MTQACAEVLQVCKQWEWSPAVTFPSLILSFEGTWKIRSDDTACNKGRMSEGPQNDEKYDVGRVFEPVGWDGFVAGWEIAVACPSSCPLWSPQYRGLKVGGQMVVQLTTDLHLIPRSWVSVGVPLLPQFLPVQYLTAIQFLYFETCAVRKWGKKGAK
jgi:hypothetical protein